MESSIPPASKFLAALISRKNSDEYAAWKAELPEQWIEAFIIQGIIPFLNKYGYTLGFSESKTVNYCKKWAFSHLRRDSIELMDWAHDGGDEEYELYQDTIFILEWHELAKSWRAPRFLDSSDAGLKQIDDLNRFVWHCISLENSPTHLDWLDSLEEEESGEQLWIAEENHAYGGDRRTY